MNKPFSVYLDAVRFAAAVLVYIYHANHRLVVESVLPAHSYGHSAVIVFFVLSGFVIAYITDTRERDWASYAASRLARVYSVALPTVLLTVALDGVGRQLAPALYGHPYDQFAVRTLASLAMLNETWFVSITSFSNMAYWSICYEFWYYVAFALVTFLPRGRGWWAAALLGLLLGPKIALLAPIWIAGVLLYRWQALRHVGLPLAWALLLASTAGIAAFHAADLESAQAAWLQGLIGKRWTVELTFSKYFLSDYLLTLLVFANFAAMRRVAQATAPLWLAIERPVRVAAGTTFTLYLLHEPLFLFWAAVLRGDPAGHGYWWATTAAVMLSVLLVSALTERKRHALRAWLLPRLAALRVAPARGRLA